MRHINEDRRQHVLSLATRLAEIAAAKRELLTQLEDLDAQARNMQLEHNRLQNLDATTSNVPDEILSMIFEAGMHLTTGSRVHFGALVSHVSRRWRSIALETPRLWTDIVCVPITVALPPTISEGRRERPAVYFSRSRSSPVNIRIKDLLAKDLTLQFLSLLGDNIGHCRRLFIDHVANEAIPLLLNSLSRHTTPILNWFSLSCKQNSISFPPYEITLMEPLNKTFLPLGAPVLTTVHVDGVDVATFHFCLPAFSSVISLRLTHLSIGSQEDYDTLRDALTRMKPLIHLELEFEYFGFHQAQNALPIILPTLQSLLLYGGSGTTAADGILHTLRGCSLISLSLLGYFEAPGDPIPETPPFPSLQHLIFDNYSDHHPNFAWIAETFPDINHLTFGLGQGTHYGSFEELLQVIQSGADDEDEDEEDEESNLRWPKLQIISVSDLPPDVNLDFDELCEVIYDMQEAGRPIDKLLLPETCLTLAQAESMAGLERPIEISAFVDDWPRPFEWII